MGEEIYELTDIIDGTIFYSKNQKRKYSEENWAKIKSLNEW